jgi:DEAD/DEAH box helicase domain-containing protein
MAGISTVHHPQVKGPAVFLYDGQPGGIGISRALFERAEPLLRATLDAIVRCACEEGCPSCIHSPRCGAGNRPLDQGASQRVLDLVLSGEPLPVGTSREAETEEPIPSRETEEAEPGRVLLLDIETQRSAEEVGGWHNTHLMRLALAVIYDVQEERFETYTEKRATELLDRLFDAELVVGFNIRRFDYGVLGAYAARPLEELVTFDLLEDLHRRLGRRVSLAHLAEETLGEAKGGDGLQAIEWFRAGELEKLETYCRRDVELVRDLMAFGEREGHVRIRTRDGVLVRVPVEWDLPAMTRSAHPDDPAVRPRPEQRAAP